MTISSQGAVKVWHASPVLRIAFTSLGVVLLVLAALVPSTDPDEPVVYRLMVAGFAVAWCVVPHYVRVELRSDHLWIRGILWTRRSRTWSGWVRFQRRRFCA